MAKALEADQPRPSGWSALMGLTRDYRGKMILLGLASFAGAMLEAGFLEPTQVLSWTGERPVCPDSLVALEHYLRCATAS